ncbi:hypothetical protein A2335_02190 [Candidatus Peregrinibacteria bacterium RIFOXYB2_FULL_32_7]|nr:MAG: hypothetical protein A2335_02190 [Candidatus Peregrinibacteria bacterium RIFOXYB2_FULL_32_7]
MFSKKIYYLFLSFFTLTIAALLLFHWISQFESEKDWIKVVVTNRNITEAIQISEQDITLKSFPKTLLNNEVFYESKTLLGLTLTKSIPKGAIIYQRDVFENIDPDSLSLKLSKDKKAFTFDENWLASKTLAKTNDKTDIIIAKENVDLNQNDFIIKNAKIINISETKNANKLITLELTDQEIRTLMYAKVNDFSIQLLIRTDAPLEHLF